MAMKRTRPDDAQSATIPLKKRRIENSNTSNSNNNNINKSKLKLTIKRSNTNNKNESSSIHGQNSNINDIRTQLLSIPELSDHSSILNKHQKKIIWINCTLLSKKNNDNSQFISLMRYYFDDDIFHTLHNNNVQFPLINTFLLNMHRIIRINNTHNNNLFILMLKFIIICYKFYTKNMYASVTPSVDLYTLENKNKLYLQLLREERVSMHHITILYENYKRFCNDSDNKYAIYGENESDKKREIELIDNYIDNVRNGRNNEYVRCCDGLCESHNNKLAEIMQELTASELFINNKYECKQTIINNEYNELCERAKKRLIAKYSEKKAKQERLFKIEFEKNHSKKEVKKEEKKDCEDAAAITPVASIRDIIFAKDVYVRRTMTMRERQIVSDWPHFSNGLMQEKWKKISGIEDNEMEGDVNTMVSDQGKGAFNSLKIKDILSMFPKCDVSYKSDANELILKKKDENLISIGVESYIACRYKGQSIMVGQVKSISSKDLWTNLRQKGDKFAKYSLINIKVQDIEEGNVKIKLIH